jgi:hypothetical protein
MDKRNSIIQKKNNFSNIGDLLWIENDSIEFKYENENEEPYYLVKKYKENNKKNFYIK